MNDQILQRLDALAAKLGVTASHLWAVLIRQAYVDFAQTCLGVLICFVGWMVAKRLIKKPVMDYDTPLPMLAVVTLGIFTIVVAIMFICSVGNLLNPEYFALNKVLGAVSGK